MDKDLLEKISETYGEREREVAIANTLHAKIDPVILGIYLLLIFVAGLWYFSARFLRGTGSILWLSVGIVAGSPPVLSLVQKAMRSRLYPRVKATCMVPVSLHPEVQFGDMDRLLEEEIRLNRKYSRGVLPPVFAFLLSPAVPVLCYRYIAGKATLPLPKGHMLTLVLLSAFCGIYGLFLMVCICAKHDAALPREIEDALRKHRKLRTQRVDQQADSANEKRLTTKQEDRVFHMMKKALYRDPPDFYRLLQAHSLGSPDALRHMALVLIPMLVDKESKAYSTVDDERCLRKEYKNFVAEFEKKVTEQGTHRKPEFEFALLAIRHTVYHSIHWTDLQNQVIPRIKELIAADALAGYPADTTEKVLESMERIVDLFTRSPEIIPLHEETGSSDGKHDDITAIGKSFVKAGIMDRPDYTDV